MQPATTYAAIVGQVIKSLRESKKINQAELAAKLNVTQATLSRIESGSVRLPMAEMARIAESLGSTPVAIVQTIEQVVGELKQKGVTVEYKDPDDLGQDLIMIGTAAVAAIALGFWLNSKKG